MSTIEKKLLSHNISSTRSHNMVHLGPLAAEIGPVVWGTAVHFNGFRVLASLLQPTRANYRKNFRAVAATVSEI